MSSAPSYFQITRNLGHTFFQEYRVLCYKSEEEADGQDEEVLASFSRLQVSESEVPEY